ncbi:hypothetical protein E4U53_006528 [Claviceps sorghi]|nr:hypothetical protein E4U53_006528 [Claviceps sorghi]
MKFSSILLACLPAALAASVGYKAPPALMTRIEKHPGSCVLPKSFLIKNFQVQGAVNATNATNATVSTNSTSPVASFRFTYVNPATKLTTQCNYHSRLTQERNETESTQRFGCKNKNISFLWAPEQSKLTAFQNICPDSHEEVEYEAVGNVIIPVSCVPGSCRAVKSSFNGLFTEINPVHHVAHPRIVRRKKPGHGLDRL